MTINIGSQNAPNITNNNPDNSSINIGSQNAENIYNVGTSGNDELTGRNDSGTDFLVGLGGQDTLIGGQGVDRFLLGKTPNAQNAEDENLSIPGETGREVFYDEAGNNDYALIKDFNVEEDVIELAGAKEDYRLGASPADLPQGTGIFRGDELIGIIENQSDLSLDASYFENFT
jgi:Ca2+-binding RTX toxin-like protein